MKFVDKIKLAFGFGPNVDPSDPLFADTGETANPTSPKVLTPDSETKPIEFDSAMQDAIFAKVVEVFNQSLPRFLAESVDREAQLRFLRKNLDEGINDYLLSLKDAARVYCEKQWKERQNDMAAEIDAIRLRAEDVEKRSNDIRQKQLSADRQKRALTERVHDLESQLARVMSEREQFELENRSLMNRLKVVSVQQEDIEKSASEMQALRAELIKLREDPSIVSKEREDAFNAKIAELTEGVEALKAQVKVADEIRDGLRSQLKQKEFENEEYLKEIERLNKEVGDLNELVSEFEKATKRMEEAENMMLKTNNAHEAELKKRDEEIESLKTIISDNIKRQSEREKMLRDEIDELRASKIPTVEIDFNENKEIIYEAPADSVVSEEDEAGMIPFISDDELTQISASFEAQANEIAETMKETKYRMDSSKIYEASEISDSKDSVKHQRTRRKRQNDDNDGSKQPSLF